MYVKLMRTSNNIVTNSKIGLTNSHINWNGNNIIEIKYKKDIIGLKKIFNKKDVKLKLLLKVETKGIEITKATNEIVNKEICVFHFLLKIKFTKKVIENDNKTPILVKRKGFQIRKIIAVNIKVSFLLHVIDLFPFKANSRFEHIQALIAGGGKKIK